jgi:hypothetical protein
MISVENSAKAKQSGRHTRMIQCIACAPMRSTSLDLVKICAAKVGKSTAIKAPGRIHSFETISCGAT